MNILRFLQSFFHLGVFTLPYTIVNGQLIDATPVQGNFTAIATALNSTINNTGIVAYTPVVRFGGLSVGVTYTQQQGSYYRIGNMIFWTFNVVLSSKGSSTGDISVGGLPFVCNSAWPTSGQNVGPLFTDNLTYTGSSVYWYLQPGQSQVAVYQNVTAPAHPTTLTDAACTNAVQLAGNGAYAI